MAEVSSGEEFTGRFSELRNQFLETHAEDISKGVYDDRDVERVRSDDFYVKLFLKHTKGNYDVSLEIMHECLKFRKEFAVYDISEESFPQDLLESGGMYPYGRDKEGNHILWFIGRKYKKDAKRQLLTKKLLIYWLEKFSIEYPGEKVTVLQDATQTGLQNMDLEMVKFIITSFKFYYPSMLAVMLIYEMPWILNAAWKVIQNWLSEEARKRVRFAGKGNIQEVIAKDTLPPYMGGTDTYEWVYVPTPPREYQETVEIEEDVDANASISTEGKPQQSEAQAPNIGNGDIKATTVRRRVHFADDTESPEKSTMSKSYSADNIDLLLSSSPQRSKETSAQQSSSHHARPRRHRRSSESNQGPLLTISPGEELVFTSHEHNKEASAVISLTNNTQGLVAFKVKTTAPEIFRVRPSAGPIAAGQSVDVNVNLHAGHEYTLRKEKFLVLSTQVQDSVKSTTALQAFWKQVPSSSVVEHRLRCSYRVVPDPSKEPAKKPADIESLQIEVTRLTSKLEQLVDHNITIERRLGSILKLLRLFVIAGILLFLLAIYYHLHFFSLLTEAGRGMRSTEGASTTARSHEPQTENILSDPSVRMGLSGQ
ncbi:motile sperm domain-containing protein 2-like isoform X1 [Ptychodera flava]|uniref:motile sperm domain-containing protein 2-like isoform X1 n=1 Tax=Ptychodera flava TaxID=63121 RepID=UPI00396A0D5B